MKTKISIIAVMALLMMAACGKTTGRGSLNIQVAHEVNGQPLVTDTLCYATEAGNPYLVNEVQWFLSRLELEDEAGHVVSLASVCYIDTDISESRSLHFDDVPAGDYRALRFVFGLNATDNVTGIFSDPPESNMFWPDALGGGYHYMKLNGKYRTDDDLLAPLAIHLGTGQNAELTEFYDNSFTVELPIELAIAEGSADTLYLVMNIDRWFSDPHVYDFNVYGSAIMQNQEAQQALKENGHDVFSIQTNNDMKSPMKTTVRLIHKAAPQPHFMTWENLKKTFSEINISKDKR